MALFSGIEIPFESDCLVLANTSAVAVCIAEAKHCVSIALFGRFSIPIRGDRKILAYSFSIGVHHTERGLCFRKSLIG